MDDFVKLTERYCATFEGQDFFWPDWLANDAKSMDAINDVMADAIAKGVPFTAEDLPNPLDAEPYDGRTIY